MSSRKRNPSNELLVVDSVGDESKTLHDITGAGEPKKAGLSMGEEGKFSADIKRNNTPEKILPGEKSRVSSGKRKKITGSAAPAAAVISTHSAPQVKKNQFHSQDTSNDLENTMKNLDATSEYILNLLPKNWKAQVAIICGSGLSGLASCLEPINDDIGNIISVDYKKIPHFPQSTVQGHKGKLVFGSIRYKQDSKTSKEFSGVSSSSSSINVVCMLGRFHFYEGFSLQQTTYPVRLFHLLGVECLLVTNAAGSLNHEDFGVGDLMILKDHVNLVGMTGLNPLRGPNLDDFGPRFPATSDAYTPGLRELARKVFDKHLKEQEADVLENDVTTDFPRFPRMKEGVYAFVSGPSYETPSEARFLKMIGGDAVGMSTIPEVIVAKHCGMSVLGLSLITNLVVMPQPGTSNTDSIKHASHQEVVQMSEKRSHFMQNLVREILQEYAYSCGASD